jgi:signal transduction histidine kinase
MSSMRKQLTWWLVAVTTCLVICVSAALYGYVRSALLGEFDASLLAKAKGLAALLRIEPDGKFDLDLAPLSENQPRGKPDYYEIILDNAVLERSVSLKHSDLVSLDAAEAHTGAWNVILPDGRHGRALALTATPRAEDQYRSPQLLDIAAKHPARIVVAYQRNEIDRALNALLSSLVIAAVVLAGASALSVQIIVTYCLRPMQRLASQAAGIGPETLDYRFAVQQLPLELQPISVKLNELLERLDNAFRRERRVSADIAHELRTPIAELRTLTEVAARWPADAAATSAYFRDVHEIALKMESLIEVLLALARSQIQRINPAGDAVRPAEVFNSVLAGLRKKIGERNLSVQCTIADSVLVHTDKPIFTRIAENLLTNAVSHTPRGGAVRCDAVQNNGDWVLSISNTNDSIEPADLEHLLEPFWRKDASRCDPTHLGLGLTLVAQYAQQLNIKLQPTLRQRDCFEMILMLPADRT